MKCPLPNPSRGPDAKFSPFPHMTSFSSLPFNAMQPLIFYHSIILSSFINNLFIEVTADMDGWGFCPTNNYYIEKSSSFLPSSFFLIYIIPSSFLLAIFSSLF
jgi:hypothetical protein